MIGFGYDAPNNIISRPKKMRKSENLIMYDNGFDEEKIRLTNNELRKFKEFETISDSECEDIIDSLVKLAIITYNLIDDEI